MRTAPGLIEVDVGEWTEKPLTRLYRAKRWPTVQRWPRGFRFPGGESFAEMSVRSLDAVLELVAEHPGETIVAVSHADPIKAVVAAAAGMPLDLMQRLVVSPCSISALLFTAGGPAVLCVMGCTVGKDGSPQPEQGDQRDSDDRVGDQADQIDAKHLRCAPRGERKRCEWPQHGLQAADHAQRGEWCACSAELATIENPNRHDAKRHESTCRE